MEAARATVSIYHSCFTLFFFFFFFTVHCRSELWKMLQLDFTQPSRRKPSFCAFGSQVHCCQSHRPLSIIAKWLVFWNNNESQPVCSSPSRIHVIIFQYFTKSAGAYVNFDLAFPSDAIPADFFPSDEEVYGYKVSYCASVSVRNRALILVFLPCSGLWCLEYNLPERSLPIWLGRL